MYNKIKKEKEKRNKKGGFLACSYNLWSLWSLPMLGDMIPLSCMYGKFLHQATRNKRKRGGQQILLYKQTSSFHVFAN